MDNSEDKIIAIEVWTELQKQLKREKHPLLSPDKFILQRDAYIRLIDDDVDSDGPFAAYEYHEITSDEDLDFAFYMFSSHFVLLIGPTEFAIPYAGYGVDSTTALALSVEDVKLADISAVSANIIETIKLLLSGRIAIGGSFQNGYLLCAETFLMGYEPRPYPIAISGNFSLLHRRSHDYAVKQNRVDIVADPVRDDFPLLPPIINGQRVRRGREVDSIHGLEPLSHAEFSKLETAASLHETMGKSTKDGTWNYFYKTIEFWAVVIVVIPALIFLRDSVTGIPDAVKPFMMMFSWVIIPTATAFLLGIRQGRLNSGQEVLSYKLEQTISRYGGRRLAVLVSSALLLLLSLFAPLWTPIGDNIDLFSGIKMAGLVPLIWLPVALMLITAVLAFKKSLASQRSARIIGMTSGIISVVSLFVINQMYMNSADAAPQAPDWAIGLLAGLSLVLIISGIMWARVKETVANEG